MTITYIHEQSLYVNVTNRCSNRCDFCIRTQADGFYADSLWLKREPTREEILDDILARRPDTFSSLVFCGYGEPTERLDDILAITKEIKERFPSLPVRLNTNGQADLIHKRSTAADFKNTFDTVSISLNAPTAEGYDAICHSRFGPNALDAVIAFASDVKAYVPEVIFSVVRGSIPDSDIDACQAIADHLGIRLRIREFIQNERN